MDFQEVIDLNDRTEDVKSNSSFDSLMISPAIVQNLKKHGFASPSPVQSAAIPAGLTGLDMLVQAKSGTGKTLVFSVLAAEHLNTRMKSTQRLILAPTREIASQIRDTIKRVASAYARIVVLVGGTPLSLDIANIRKGAHIVIGTVGRISQLAQLGHLSLDSVELLVLDEADKLMDECFQNDINYLFSCLPPSRQVTVFSATYPRGLDVTLSKYMKDVTLIRLNAEDVQLIGIKQYVVITSEYKHTTLKLLLNSIMFSQALVFCNYQQDCNRVSDSLSAEDLSVAVINAQMSQTERDNAIFLLKNNKIKVLISTDLTARGIDATNVNLVINMEPAVNCETYFHRIGRAARFGGQGAAITLINDNKEKSTFLSLCRKNDVHVRMLSDKFPHDLTSNTTYFDSAINFVEASDASLESEKKELNVNDSMNSSDSRDTEHEKVPSVTVNNYAREIQNYLSTEELVPLPKDEPKKVFKFVSSRQKAKRKFYMRGEMIAICEGLTHAQWRDYANTKYNLDEEPFKISKTLFTNEKKMNGQQPNKSKSDVSKIKQGRYVKPAALVKDNEGSLSHEVEKEASSQVPNQIKKYSRQQLIAVKKKYTPAVWTTYIKSKYDTSEEPFELNQQMRCSYEQKLRNARAIEKAERNKIIAERKAALEAKPRFISCSRWLQRDITLHSTLETFTKSLSSEFASLKNTPGAVVPLRDSKAEWRSRVDFYSEWLHNFESTFMRNVLLTSEAISDSSCSPIYEITRTTVTDGDCQTEEEGRITHNNYPIQKEVIEEIMMENDKDLLVEGGSRLKTLLSDDPRDQFQKYCEFEFCTVFNNYMSLLHNNGKNAL